MKLFIRRLSTLSLMPLAGGLFITACASTGADYQPIVDGSTGPAYQADLQDCQQLAQTRQYDNGDVRTSAAVGAGIGGIIGLADGGVGDAVGGALIGGLIGGGSETFETREERKEIVMNCMIGRGHRVVG